MIWWITEEGTGSGMSTEFVGSDRCLIRKAQAAENTELLVAGRSTEQALKRGHLATGLARAAIEEMCGGAQCLGPICSRHAGMN